MMYRFCVYLGYRVSKYLDGEPVHPILMYRSCVYLGCRGGNYLDCMPLHPIMMYRSCVYLGCRESKYLHGMAVHPIVMYRSCVYLGCRVSKCLDGMSVHLWCTALVNISHEHDFLIFDWADIGHVYVYVKHRIEWCEAMCNMYITVDVPRQVRLMCVYLPERFSGALVWWADLLFCRVRICVVLVMALRICVVLQRHYLNVNLKHRSSLSSFGYLNNES